MLLWYLAPGGGAAATLRRVAAFGGGAFLVCAPWMARNMAVLGTAGLRSNLGVELNVGNNDDSDGWHQKSRHPGLERRRERRACASSARAPTPRRPGAQATAWMRANPGRFVALSLTRLRLVWLGVPPSSDTRSADGVSAAADPKSWVRWVVHLVTGVVGVAGLFVFARGRPEGTLIRGVVLLFGAPYYVTHVLERYRFPMDPLLVLAGAGLVAMLRERAQAPRPRADRPA